MNLDALIRSVQAHLGVTVDGKPGPQTWQAIADALGTAQVIAPPVSDPVDSRSEGVIGTLLPEVRPYARALIHAAAAQGITIKVISGLRTYAEQDALYAKGRTTTGPKVTNARGGYSNHNFGVAWDVGVFRDGVYVPESREYDAVGALGKSLGLSWGGDWTTIQDAPHYELRPDWARNLSESEMLAEFRERKEAGEALF